MDRSIGLRCTSGNSIWELGFGDQFTEIIEIDFILKPICSVLMVLAKVYYTQYPL